MSLDKKNFDTEVWNEQNEKFQMACQRESTQWSIP